MSSKIEPFSATKVRQTIRSFTLHLRTDHPCGERKGPHVHIVRRRNLNGASAKTGRPARVVAGVVTGGTVRRASPAMVATYHEYLIENYHRLRAVACE